MTTVDHLHARDHHATIIMQRFLVTHAQYIYGRGRSRDLSSIVQAAAQLGDLAMAAEPGIAIKVGVDVLCAVI